MNTAAIVRAAAAALRSPKMRKALGWVAALILSPVILFLVLLLCVGSGAAGHNRAMADLFISDAAVPSTAPSELEGAVGNLQDAFTALDCAAKALPQIAGNSVVDLAFVKAAYFVLCSDVSMRAETFLRFFYTIEEESGTGSGGNIADPGTGADSVAVPRPTDTVFSLLAAALNRDVTATDRERIQHLYDRISANTAHGSP